MTKEQVISKVNESAGSLFTKEDVIKLIESIEGTTKIDFEELANRLESIVDDADNEGIEVNSRRFATGMKSRLILFTLKPRIGRVVSTTRFVSWLRPPKEERLVSWKRRPRNN
jgi:hypothetical protein